MDAEQFKDLESWEDLDDWEYWNMLTEPLPKTFLKKIYMVDADQYNNIKQVQKRNEELTKTCTFLYSVVLGFVIGAILLLFNLIF